MKPKMILEAIEQCKSHCRMLISQSNYEVVSVRGILRTLGYENDQRTIILRNIADGGFTYCLDHHIKCSNGDPENPAQEYPHPDVCYWSPDQLLSRLESLYFG